MSGRHLVTDRTFDRSRASAFFGPQFRNRLVDVAAAVCGMGAAVTGVQFGGATGAGIAAAGVGLPTVWLAWGAGRSRRRLSEEQTIRRRAATMAAAQDTRIQALRQRLRSLDTAQSIDRGELAIAQSGLLTTRVELASMRSQLAATRHELSSNRTELMQVRDQLAAILSHQVVEDTPSLFVAGSGADLPTAHRLILPPGLVLPSSGFAHADRQVFDAFAESDLDDMTGIISVSALADHARDRAADASDVAASVAAAAQADLEELDEVASSAA